MRKAGKTELEGVIQGAEPPEYKKLRRQFETVLVLRWSSRFFKEAGDPKEAVKHAKRCGREWRQLKKMLKAKTPKR